MRNRVQQPNSCFNETSVKHLVFALSCGAMPKCSACTSNHEPCVVSCSKLSKASCQMAQTDTHCETSTMSRYVAITSKISDANVWAYM